MIVHGGAGLDDHARQQARRYAELGYVVLACDMFGRDTAGGPREQIIALLTGMRDDPDRLVRRDERPVSSFPGPGHRQADGGRRVLLRRPGRAPARPVRCTVAAAVSIDGSLAPASAPCQARCGRGCSCATAPWTRTSARRRHRVRRRDERRGADWQLNMYGGAQHGFTHTDAKPGAIPGVAYQEQADTLSFAATRDFLARAFGKTR